MDVQHKQVVAKALDSLAATVDKIYFYDRSHHQAGALLWPPGPCWTESTSVLMAVPSPWASRDFEVTGTGRDRWEEQQRCDGEGTEALPHRPHQQGPGLMHRPLHRVTHTHILWSLPLTAQLTACLAGWASAESSHRQPWLPGAPIPKMTNGDRRKRLENGYL